MFNPVKKYSVPCILDPMYASSSPPAACQADYNPSFAPCGNAQRGGEQMAAENQGWDGEKAEKAQKSRLINFLSLCPHVNIQLNLLI